MHKIEDLMLDTNPIGFNMSVELSSEDATIVVLAKYTNKRNIPLTLDCLDGFISKLKESLILPPEQRWKISFSADQTYLSAFCSSETTGSPTDSEADIPTGASSEG